MAVFEREVLPNGLRLLTAPMPQVQSVACFIMLAAGSRYETPESSGIVPHHTSPPKVVGEFADFCGRMVRRYS